MADDYKFIEYTPEVGDAIRRAKSITPQKIRTDVYPKGKTQQLLPPVMSMNTGTGTGIADVYDGPFAMFFNAETQTIDISAGFLNRNGEFLMVPSCSIVPESGFICVNSNLNSGVWSPPEIKFAVPDASNYPIGRCIIDGETVKLYPFYVTVAVILITAYCPVSECT